MLSVLLSLSLFAKPTSHFKPVFGLPFLCLYELKVSLAHELFDNGVRNSAPNSVERIRISSPAPCLKIFCLDWDFSWTFMARLCVGSILCARKWPLKLQL